MVLDQKIEEVKHDRLILENLLMTYNVVDAKAITNIICDKFLKDNSINIADYESFGDEKEKIILAVEAFVKVLENIGHYNV